MKSPGIVFWFLLLSFLAPHARAAGKSQKARPASVPASMHLRVGQTVTRQVLAADPNNNTRLSLRAGEVYDFACDINQHWKDTIFIKVSPAGDASRFYRAYMSLYDSRKRCPKAPWFSLIGKVGTCDKACFLIGSGKPGFRVSQAGALYCFANDVKGFYFNNHGEVSLRVTRRR